MTEERMKKLLLTTAIILVLASCETKTMTKDYRDQENLPFPYITHFEYKGHDYIFFGAGRANGAVGGVVHDPDCKCKENKKE